MIFYNVVKQTDSAHSNATAQPHEPPPTCGGDHGIDHWFYLDGGVVMCECGDQLAAPARVHMTEK